MLQNICFYEFIEQRKPWSFTHRDPVFLSLMVLQKEILDKPGQELSYELMMEAWYAFLVYVTRNYL